MERGTVAVKTRRMDRLTEIHKTTTITRKEKSCNEGKRRQTTECLGEDASVNECRETPALLHWKKNYFAEKMRS